MNQDQLPPASNGVFLQVGQDIQRAAWNLPFLNLHLRQLGKNRCGQLVHAVAQQYRSYC